MSAYKHRRNRSFSLHKHTRFTQPNRFKWVNKDLKPKALNASHSFQSVAKELNVKPFVTTCSKHNSENRYKSKIAELQARIRNIEKLEDKLAEESEIYQDKSNLLNRTPISKSSSMNGKLLPSSSCATKKAMPKSSLSFPQASMPSSRSENSETNFVKTPSLTDEFVRTKFTLKKRTPIVGESQKVTKRNKVSTKSMIASKYRFDRRTKAASKTAPPSYILDRRTPPFKKAAVPLSLFHWENATHSFLKRNSTNMSSRKTTLSCQTRGSKKFLFSKFKMRPRTGDEMKITKISFPTPNKSMESPPKYTKRLKSSQHFYR